MLATWGTSTGFNPASLFAGGVQGAWYDPSDNTTMFQDSAGTTPVTAVEQAVGLILDKSKGLVLGSELVTNGTFDTSTTGWSITSSSVTTSVSAIGVTLTNVSANGGISQSISGLIVGRTYRFSANVTAGTTNGIIQVGDLVNEGQSLQLTGVSGQISAVFVAGSTSRVVSLRTNSASVGAACSFDNVSVRELAGNHAYQSTSASRPTLRARYNLLTYSEEFDNAAWSKIAAGAAVAPVVTANAGTAPDGTTTADRIQFDCGNAGSSANRSYITPLAGNPITSGVSYIASVYVKAFDAGNVGRQIRFSIDSLTNGVFTLTADWQRITLTATATATTTSNFLIETRGTFTQQTADVLVWGAQFIQTNVFPSNVYQRIAAATDYATGAAFPQYLSFDGTDDSLLTASVDFTGTDKMTVWAGVTKNSDAARGTVVELSADIGTNAGSFALRAPQSAAGAGDYGFFARGSGTLAGGATAASYAAPITSVLTGLDNISTDALALRINGTQVLSDTSTDQGTGNFGNYPLYIGRRNNATIPFNGRIYSLIVRGAESNSTQIAQTERYVASKTPLGVVP